MSTWLTTGCSSGLGRHLAEAALEAGHDALVTARDVSTVEDLVRDNPQTALALPLDVTDDAQIVDVVGQAEERFGRVDVLVNNAGYGYRAAVEEGEVEAVARLFATNFFGAVAMIKTVLPAMRARRQGTIVNISSIGARICPPGSGYYAASKAALESMTASLRKEVGPLGITAMVVEPGGFRTDFGGRSLQQSRDTIADYADTAGKRRKENESATNDQRQGDPAKAARAIIAAVLSPEPPFMLMLGNDALAGFRGHLDARRAETDALGKDESEHRLLGLRTAVRSRNCRVCAKEREGMLGA
jgi:NAD(P)-dependent dehydrogenase (short-subunit alcohol dehydrogenase family)